MKIFLIISALFATGCVAQFPCFPSPPKDLRIVELHAHSVAIEFEDPDDLDECPIASYHPEIEKVVVAIREQSNVGEYIPTGRTHRMGFPLLEASTVYRLSVISVSTLDVFSHPAIIEFETLAEQSK